jgi:uncharacterized protein (TIGR03000 family)
MQRIDLISRQDAKAQRGIIRILILILMAVGLGTEVAGAPPPASPGAYIGGYSGGNNRGGSTGVYIGGNPAGGGRADGSGYYIGGYPGVNPQAIGEKNYPGYKGSTSRVYPEYPEPSYPPPQDPTALITVWLPYEADLWVQDKRVFHSVSIVKFRTPALVPGKEHRYTFRARWNEGGQVFVETRTVSVQAGEKVKVNFRPNGQ